MYIQEWDCRIISLIVLPTFRTMCENSCRDWAFCPSDCAEVPPTPAFFLSHDVDFRSYGSLVCFSSQFVPFCCQDWGAVLSGTDLTLGGGGAGHQVGGARKALRQEESGSAPLLAAFTPHFAKAELGNGIVCSSGLLESGFCLLLLQLPVTPLKFY